ncbi:hypothetical protein AAHH79_35525, partial [Burkholderia pseudomallei]
MQPLIRAAASCVLVSSLAECVVTPPRPAPAPAPRPSPQEDGYERMQQIQGRLDNQSHRIDERVNDGY